MDILSVRPTGIQPVIRYHVPVGAVHQRPKWLLGTQARSLCS